ncbi:MAG: HD-GYP domain-containing protein [Proteobacteria bacterium]|nr:HD-GYP domain-containing protein [Pseudomonadota bacterium]NOG59517.1 HD-GYP domain-containing protein [Pseudomonadota bacterium]
MLDNNNYEVLCLYTEALSCALKHRDAHTQLHSQRIVLLSEELGKSCSLSENEIFILKIASCLHDIGKIGIPDNILLKQGKHNPEEWEIMKSHSTKGADIVKKLPINNTELISNIVRHHHEHYDGCGYPDKLSGENIPIMARIISVTDSYDAMTDTRPYHPAKTHKKAIEILNDEKGNKSDPYVLNKFLSRIETSSYRVE